MKSSSKPLLVLAALLAAGSLFSFAFPQLANRVFEKIGSLARFSTAEKSPTADRSKASQTQVPLCLSAPSVEQLDTAATASTNLPGLSTSPSAAQWFAPGEAGSLCLLAACLEVPAGALATGKLLHLRALTDPELRPLEPGMMNVTARCAGYRMKPNGRHFSPSAVLRLGYELALIPDGYTARDVRTFFFNEATAHWEQLPLDSVWIDCETVVSRTDHFTDFIAGIIKAPDAPTTTAFQKNSITDFKAAAPSANMALIAPPTADNTGAASLNFPIKIPQGRQGMQPSLAITYNSEGGNGWLGEHWDLSLPSVSMDTRWGVPRYYPNKETETYSLSGSQLWPVAHRAAWVPRSAGDKRFWLRREGDFSKIIRHGNSPKNYWWEVTVKNGTRYFYGGSTDGLNENGVLRDTFGNIGHWALTEVRDANNNFVRYRYAKVWDVGMAQGAVVGQQLYVRQIVYTGHGNSGGAYKIQFIRDRELKEARRPDVDINCSLGFKQVTADLLRRIDVCKGETLVRSYELTYTQGAFFKTLLDTIIERDKNGVEFYRHRFEYYDDVRKNGAYQPYRSEQNWTVPFYNVNGGINTGDPAFNGDGSVLSSSKSSSSSANAAITGGLNDFNYTAKTGTIGGNFGTSDSDTEGLATLVDINGDGLPDKVFKHNDTLWYCANRSKPGELASKFDLKHPIVGIQDFNISNTSGSSGGVEAYPWIVFIGAESSGSTTTITTYLSDFNADGLIDIAHNGHIYFNRLNADGGPEFLLSSAGTPSPIVDNAKINPNLVVFDPAKQEELIDKHPLHDVVRMWEAPFDGTIGIHAPVQLVNDPAAVNYLQKDGVRLAIQHGATELWSDKIQAGDFAPHVPTLSPFPVKKGGRIYFRVQSNVDGKYDQVQWDPEIKYTNTDISPTELDANGRLLHRYKASEDFLLASPQTLTMPLKGTIDIEGVFTKPPTSDSVRVEVLLGNAPLYGQWFDWKIAVNQPIVLKNVQVNSLDQLTFRVKSFTNVNWSAIRWMPSFHYTSADNGTKVVDANGNFLLSSCPAVGFSMYNDVRVRTPLLTPSGGGLVTLRPNLPTPLPSGATGQVTLSLKGVNTLYGETTFSVALGQILPASPVVTANVPPGETLYIEYHIADSVLAGGLFGAGTPTAIFTQNGNAVTVGAGLYAGRPNEEVLFGPLYRGWGHFVYNGNRERAGVAIIESDLQLDTALFGLALNVQNIKDPAQLLGAFTPDKAKFIILVSDPKNGLWRGLDPLTWIKSDHMSSSRMGKDDILFLNPATPSTGANAPHKMSESSSSAISGSLSVPIPIPIPIGLSISASTSSGDVRGILEVIDLNRDGIPDYRSETGSQFSTATGELEPGIVADTTGSHYAESTGWNVGGGGGGNAAVPKQGNTGPQSGTGSPRRAANVMAANDKASYNSGSSHDSAHGSAGVSFSGNVGGGSDDTHFSLLDINGDGLPDRVYAQDSVALNLGYRFAAKETWGQTFIRGGKNEETSAGAGINLFGGSTQGGVSFSKTTSWSNKALQDLNGDGLLDALLAGTPLKVMFNTGSGFASAVDWNGLDVPDFLDKNSATGQATTGGVTFCVPILPILPIFKACFNLAGSSGSGVSRQLSQITDVDGDGFPDYLESENDGELRVRASTIARTNLLRRVVRPLGGSFALDYQHLPNTYAMPHAQWVLRNVETEDGLAGDGPDQMRTELAYADGLYHRREKEFLGYQTVTTTQLDTEHGNKPYRRTVQVFENRYYHLKGLLLRENVQDTTGKIFAETRNEYQVRHLATGAVLAPDFDKNASETAFPALTKTQKNIREGQPAPGLQNEVTFDYDLLGNVTDYADAGDGSANNWVKASIQYHSLPGPYIMGEPKSILVTTVQGLQRKRGTSIDNQGNVTQIQQFLANGDKAEMDMAYDKYGNLVKITRPKNHLGKRLAYAYAYDPEVHTYVTKTTDSYGYKSSSVYDLLFGTLLETTDLNGQQIKYALDAKGRIETITGPYELAANKSYTIRFEYHPEAKAPYALTRHFDPETNKDIETVTFTDGLARPVQVKKTGAFFAGDGVADEVGMIVSGRTVFDAFGRTVKAFYPTREVAGSATVFNPNFDSITPTTTTYDLLDRSLTSTLPDGATSSMTYDLAPDNSGTLCSRSIATDALGNSKSTFTDVRGRQRATLDNAPDSSQIWTDFRYDGLSQLVKVTDDASSETTYDYDFFGRKISVKHPEAGLTEFKYDLAGNMTEKITANIRERIPNGGAIRYSYEFERLVQIDYPKNFHNRVQFQYGDSTAGFNRRGRIVLQQDASGGQEFYYGPLGEVVKNIRTVLVSKAVQLNFVTEYQYDTWERVQKIVYPDGEVVTYDYNRAGKLRSMNGLKLGETHRFVAQLGYDKFEQRTFLRYGNGTVTNYAYEPDRRRLAHMDVTLPSGRAILQNDYGYDAVSNILSIANKAPGIQQLQLGGPASQTFEYDNLYRLTHATGVCTGFNHQDRYDLRMAYSNTHDIVRKTQTHLRDSTKVEHTSHDLVYTYDTVRLHIPAKIGRQRYTYDANGNQTGWRDQPSFEARDLLWDEENRIMGIWDNGYLSRYTYDAAGERILKSHGGAQVSFIDGAPAAAINHLDNYTAYPSAYLTARENTFTKHYYIESQRIASVVGTGKFNNSVLPAHPEVTAGSLDYAKRMQELEGAALAFYASVTSPGHPTLYGLGAQPEVTGKPIPTLSTGAYTLPPPHWPNLPIGQPPAGGPPQAPVWVDKPIPHDSIRAGFNFTGNKTFTPENDQYFYHPDHLGSTSYVTGPTGEIRQHLEYFPFGETFVDEHDPGAQQPYRLTGKELDSETGLYYFGARYQDPRIGMWASVDPMAEKYPGWSGYNYVMLNPVKLVDPDGREPITLTVLATAFVVGAGIEGWSQVGGVAMNGFDVPPNHTLLNSAFKMAFDGALNAAGVGVAKNAYKLGKAGKALAEPAFSFLGSLSSQYVDNKIEGKGEVSFLKGLFEATVGNYLSSKAGGVMKKIGENSMVGNFLRGKYLEAIKNGDFIDAATESAGNAYRGYLDNLENAASATFSKLLSNGASSASNFLSDLSKIKLGSKPSRIEGGKGGRVIIFDPVVIEVKRPQ